MKFSELKVGQRFFWNLQRTPATKTSVDTWRRREDGQTISIGEYGDENVFLIDPDPLQHIAVLCDQLEEAGDRRAALIRTVLRFTPEEAARTQFIIRMQGAVSGVVNRSPSINGPNGNT